MSTVLGNKDNYVVLTQTDPSSFTEIFQISLDVSTYDGMVQTNIATYVILVQGPFPSESESKKDEPIYVAFLTPGQQSYDNPNFVYETTKGSSMSTGDAVVYSKLFSLGVITETGTLVLTGTTTTGSPAEGSYSIGLTPLDQQFFS